VRVRSVVRIGRFVRVRFVVVGQVNGHRHGSLFAVGVSGPGFVGRQGDVGAAPETIGDEMTWGSLEFPVILFPLAFE
jgi:hypothetical protein